MMTEAKTESKKNRSRADPAEWIKRGQQTVSLSTIQDIRFLLRLYMTDRVHSRPNLAASSKKFHYTLGRYRVPIVGRHGYRGGSTLHFSLHTYFCFSICTAYDNCVTRWSQLHMECLHAPRVRNISANHFWCIQSSRSFCHAESLFKQL